MQYCFLVVRCVTREIIIEKPYLKQENFFCVVNFKKLGCPMRSLSKLSNSKVCRPPAFSISRSKQKHSGVVLSYYLHKNIQGAHTKNLGLNQCNKTKKWRDAKIDLLKTEWKMFLVWGESPSWQMPMKNPHVLELLWQQRHW